MNKAKRYAPNHMLLWFVLPAFLFYAVFVLFPAFGGIVYSLTNWNGLNRTYRLIGFENYIEALTTDTVFLKSLLFTFKYVIAIVVLENVIALLLAVMVESRRRGRGLLRTVFFLPNMTSMIIAGFLWLFIFTRVIPYIAEHSFLHFLGVAWIGDARFSFIAILIVSLWGGVGYLMVIYIAALQGVPKELEEAAGIDGANSIKSFLHITLPMIMPSLTICTFVTLSNSFKVFDVVYALTGGGPGYDTQVVALNIYREAYSLNNRYGYASAKAMILFAIIAIITGIQLWVMKRREVEA